MSRPIVLLTDFGPSEYAGVLRGVLLSRCPGAALIDLTHQVPAQDVRGGAWILLASFRYFPAGAVFLAVVDPGVGTGRAALALRTRRYFFVGPDNGLLIPAARTDGIEAAVALPVPADASPTFHGRDVFAPAAAALAAGAPLSSLGPSCQPRTELQFHRRGREGEVVRVDPFGNVITNLPPLPAARYRVRLGGWQGELPAARTYGDVPGGSLAVVVGSAGTLELARAGGSAAAVLGALPGQRITLE